MSLRVFGYGEVQVKVSNNIFGNSQQHRKTGNRNSFELFNINKFIVFTIFNYEEKCTRRLLFVSAIQECTCASLLSFQTSRIYSCSPARELSMVHTVK